LVYAERKEVIKKDTVFSREEVVTDERKLFYAERMK
jgi:hypothetical protein